MYTSTTNIYTYFITLFVPAARPCVRMGYEDGVSLADQDMDAQRRPARRVIDHAPQLAHRAREGARDAGDHRIALAELDQQAAEDVAILVDHPLAIAAQIAAAMEPEIGRAHV